MCVVAKIQLQLSNIRNERLFSLLTYPRGLPQILKAILIVVFTVANSGLAFYSRDKIFKAHLSSCTQIAENANKKSTLRSCNFRVTIDWHATRFAIKRRKTSNKIEILKPKSRTSLPTPTEKVHRFMAGISVKIFTWFSFSIYIVENTVFWY